MLCRITDLRDKEVINIKNGCRLGYVDDVEVNTCNAKVCAIVVFGRSRFFGLLGREEDIVICWDEIEIIGENTVLVCSSHEHTRRFVRKNFLDGLFE
jgi:YlmC/YmxH family sporulation protein